MGPRGMFATASVGDLRLLTSSHTIRMRVTGETDEQVDPRTPYRLGAVDAAPASLGYQHSKTELEEETDMPGLSDEVARRLFFRPFRSERIQAKE